MKKRLISTIMTIVLLLLIMPFESGVFAIAPYFWAKSDEKGSAAATIELNEFFAYGNGAEKREAADIGKEKPATGPFGLREGNHFANLAKLVSIGYLNIPYYYEIDPNLSAPIDLSAYALPPIGSAEYPFYGYFNGNGKTISNPKTLSGKMNNHNGISEYDDIGFFGFLAYHSKVENLILDNPTIISGVYDEKGPLDNIPVDPITQQVLEVGYTLSYSGTSIKASKSTTANNTYYGDVFFTINTSDQRILTINLDTATPNDGANGTAAIQINANKRTSDGLMVSKVVAEYSITVANGVFTSYTENIDFLLHKHKHVGIAVGHAAGNLFNVSIYGGAIEAELKHHTSDYGSIGYIDEMYVDIGNINGISPIGDVGYLYGDYLMGAINKPITWFASPIQDPGAKENSRLHTEYYLGGTNANKVGNNSNGAIQAQTETSITFKTERYIEGFGVFGLVTNEATTITTLPQAARSEFIFQGVYPVNSPNANSISMTIPTANATNAEYPNAGTSINLNDTLPANPNAAQEKADYLRGQIINPYYGNKRINSFSYGFAVQSDMKTNQTPQPVHNYYGTNFGTARSSMMTGYLVFNIRENSYYTQAYSDYLAGGSQGTAPPKWDTSKYVDIIAVTYSAATNTNADFFLATRVIANGFPPISESQFRNSVAGQYSIYIFRINYSAYNYSLGAGSMRGSFALSPQNGSNGNFPNTRFIYLAVGGQEKGEAGAADKDELFSVDFVYKKGTAIVPITANDYVFSMATIHFASDFTTDNSVLKIYFRRTETAFPVYATSTVKFEYYGNYTMESFSGSDPPNLT